MKEPKLVEKVQASIKGDQITLTYSSKGQIFTKTIAKDLTLDELTPKQVDTQVEGDVVKRTTSDHIDYWFDNYFLASGIQRINNDSENLRRNVFYLNKVSF